jgi:hypothetical protein
MRKLFYILILIPIFVQGQTIYQTGFETGIDGWKFLVGHGSRVGVTYGIHPVGSYMLDVNQTFMPNVHKLNLKAGRTYHFSFKYNNSLTGGQDTTYISQDSILNVSNALSGTTKIGLPTSHTGIGDINWHIINFNATPTANGGYWRIDSYYNYSEILIDSLTVTGDTTTASPLKRLKLRKK